MLFLYENQEKNLQGFEAYKIVNFHFRLGTILARRETGDSRAVTSIKER